MSVTAKNYLYNIDFKAHEDDLLALSAGDKPDEIVANILKDVTGDPWSMDPAAFSLKDAEVEYVGKNKTMFASNSRYENVVVIKLSKACVLFAEKRIILQLNFQ